MELFHEINKLPEPVARFYHFFPFVRAGLLNSISPDILKLGELRELDETCLGITTATTTTTPD